MFVSWPESSFMLDLIFLLDDIIDLCLLYELAL